MNERTNEWFFFRLLFFHFYHSTDHRVICVLRTLISQQKKKTFVFRYCKTRTFWEADFFFRRHSWAPLVIWKEWDNVSYIFLLTYSHRHTYGKLEITFSLNGVYSRKVLRNGPGMISTQNWNPRRGSFLNQRFGQYCTVYLFSNLSNKSQWNVWLWKMVRCLKDYEVVATKDITRSISVAPSTFP